MLTPRRVVTVAGVVTILLLFFYSISGSSDGRDGIEVSTQNRKYPPSFRKGRSQQHTIQDMASRPLRDRIKYYFPYDVGSRFPAYIWQTWKASPSSGDFDPNLRLWEAAWTEKHPGFVHEVIIDDAAEHLVRYLFASVPEVAEAYSAMPLPVLKADFFRYLILLARGGIYSDIDTQPIKSAPDWVPQDLDQSTIGMVIGIEADPDREDWKDWYARRIQFCQWTIQAKPGHPVLRDLVATITESALAMKTGGQLTKGYLPNTKSVMEFTGPGVWTDAIFTYFNSNERPNVDTHKPWKNVTVNDFFNLDTHKKVADIMVLPITGFSPGVGQMGAGGTDDPMACVHHEFDGSWKPEKERRIGKNDDK